MKKTRIHRRNPAVTVREHFSSREKILAAFIDGRCRRCAYGQGADTAEEVLAEDHGFFSCPNMDTANRFSRRFPLVGMSEECDGFCPMQPGEE